MNQIHTHEVVAKEMCEDNAGERRYSNRSSKSFPRFAGADARDHLVFADERTDSVSAGIAEFGNQDEIDHVIFSVAGHGRRKRKEIYLLNEVQQPGYIHETEKSR